MQMCLHHFLNECKSCIIDLDQTHHPNNTDCPRFHKVVVQIMEVEDDN